MTRTRAVLLITGLSACHSSPPYRGELVERHTGRDGRELTLHRHGVDASREVGDTELARYATALAPTEPVACSAATAAKLHEREAKAFEYDPMPGAPLVIERHLVAAVAQKLVDAPVALSDHRGIDVAAYWLPGAHGEEVDCINGHAVFAVYRDSLADLPDEEVAFSGFGPLARAFVYRWDLPVESDSLLYVYERSSTLEVIVWRDRVGERWRSSASVALVRHELVDALGDELAGR